MLRPFAVCSSRTGGAAARPGREGVPHTCFPSIQAAAVSARPFVASLLDCSRAGTDRAGERLSGSSVPDPSAPCWDVLRSTPGTALLNTIFIAGTSTRPLLSSTAVSALLRRRIARDLRLRRYRPVRARNYSPGKDERHPALGGEHSAVQRDAKDHNGGHASALCRPPGAVQGSLPAAGGAERDSRSEAHRGGRRRFRQELERLEAA